MDIDAHCSESLEHFPPSGPHSHAVATARGVVNMTAVAVVEAQAR
jgi:hypothetical protein